MRSHRYRPGFLRAVLPVLLTALLALALCPVRPGPAAATPGLTTGQVTVTLHSLTPSVLKGGDTLTVTATVHNRGQASLIGAEAVLASRSQVTSTRSAINSWVKQGPETAIGGIVTTNPVPTLDPGRDAEITFTVTPADLRLTADSPWGSRGLTVAIVSGGVRIAALRTFTAWAPPGTVDAAVGLTVLAAVTGPPVDATHPEDAATRLEATTSTTGRLGRLVAATAAHPEVGWVIDPAVVRAAAAEPATQPWAKELLRAQSGRDTAALPTYDVDLAAYAHHPEVPVPAEPASTPADPTSTWRRDVAWPADSTPDIATVAINASRGANNVVVGSGMQPVTEQNHTPSGVATVATPNGPATALIADEVLSGLLAGSTPENAPKLLAETAVIARERPSQMRELLAVLDRSWDPNVASFGTSISALHEAPWVHFSTIDALRSTPVPGLARTALPASTSGEKEISGASLAGLQAARAEAAGFAVVTPDPAKVTEPLEPSLVTPTSISYRSDPTARRLAVSAGVTAVAKVANSSITIAPREPVGVGSNAVDFPVLIRNSLDQPVTVQVVLESSSSWLQQVEVPTLTIPPRGESSLAVPVRITASGTVMVTVHAQTVAGLNGSGGVDVAEPIGTKAFLLPDVDAVATWVVVAGVMLLLVGGIWRMVRRGRSPRREPAVTAEHPLPELKRVP